MERGDNPKGTNHDLEYNSSKRSVKQPGQFYEQKSREIGENSNLLGKGKIKVLDIVKKSFGCNENKEIELKDEIELVASKRKLESLAKRLNNLKSGYFDFEDIKKNQNLKIYKIPEIIKNNLKWKWDELLSIGKELRLIDNEIDKMIQNGKIDSAIKDIQGKCSDLMEDFTKRGKQFEADEKIIAAIQNHQNGPDVKSLIERQDFLDNLRAFQTKKRQDDGAFGAEREVMRKTRHAFLDAMMKQANETGSITLPKGFELDPETNEITLPEEFKVDLVGSKGLFTELCYKLAQMDSYTSVKDSSGRLIFTREMYESFQIENLKGGIKTVFDKTPFSPEGLINKLEGNRYLAELYQGDVGVWEGYTLRQHTLMVMDRFEHYCAASWNSSVLTKDDFRLMLALHDIGKPQAVKETGGTSAQHAYALRIVPEVLKQLGISEDKARVMASIIDQGYIGSQMKRHIPLGGLLRKTYSEEDGEHILAETKEDAKNISAKAEKLGIETAEYFELIKVYYQCDAASYTKDAPGGKRALDHLFEFTEDPVSGRKTMEFSKLAKRAFSILDNYVKEEDLERKRRSTGTID